MEIATASPELRQAAEDWLAPQMVAALLDGAAVNLADDVDCIIKLRRAGFGSRSITALLPRVRSEARRSTFEAA